MAKKAPRKHADVVYRRTVNAPQIHFRKSLETLSSRGSTVFFREFQKVDHSVIC